MKQSRLGMILLLLAILGVGCSTPTSSVPARGGLETGLTLHWEWADARRTLLPDSYPDPVKFDVELTAAGQTTVSRTGLAEKIWNLQNLPSAVWSVTVKGYDAAGTLLVVGGDSVDLVSKTNHAVAITLYYQSSGTGQYHLSLKTGAALESGATVQVTLTDPLGKVATEEFPFGSTPVDLVSTEAPAGTYRVFVKVLSGSKVAMKMESLLVFQGVDTDRTLNFEEKDFGVAYIPVSSVILPSTLNLTLKQDAYLKADTLPLDASHPEVTWKSSSPTVVSVDALSGRVVALSFGEASITATSAEGLVSAPLVASVVVDNSPATLQQGKDQLSQRRYTEALATFEKANSTEATFYKALLKLASLAVHPDTVKAAKNVVGLRDYPLTMEELFSTGWFAGQFYNKNWVYEYYPEIKVPGTNTTVSGYSVNYYQYIKQTMPAIDIPTEVLALGDSSAPGQTMDQYFAALVLNLLTKDPEGLNALMDNLDSGVFGAGWEEVLTMLAALPDDATLTLDFQGSPSLPSWVPFATLPVQKVVIGKAELLAEAATLSLLRGTFQWLKAQDYSFPAQAVVQAIDFKTGRFKAVPQGKNPLQGTFLTLRDPSSLTRAKASFATGLGFLLRAVELVQARTDAAPFDLKPSLLGLNDSVLAQVSKVLGQAKTIVENGSSLYLPSDPKTLLDGSTDLITPASDKTEIKVGAFFDGQTPLIQRKEILVLNADETAPLWFADRSRSSRQMVQVGPGLNTPIAGSNTLFIKVRLGPTLGRVLPAAMLPSDDVMTTYLPVSTLTQGDKLMAWFGQTWTPPVEITVGAY